MKITIETIPHEKQLYETCGDWRFDADGDLNIKVSELGDWRMEVLVGVHELVESVLCYNRGVKESDVTDFDIAFEILRDSFPEIIGNTEPGDMVSAPYYNEHQFATKIEKKVAEELGVDWDSYSKTINSL